MKLYRFLALLAAAVLLVPSLAFAHERQVFSINGKQYLFIVGSIGEPVVVDDKTAVDLTVKLADPADLGNASSPKATPVTGLEKTLKVEIAAGGKKQTFDLAPAYGVPGAYRAVFFPTVETTYSYRFFGTIDNTPVDVTFTCMTGDMDMATGTAENQQISDTVTRVFQAGGFGCPVGKADLSFPEQVPTQLELAHAASGPSLDYVAIAIAAVALGFSMRRKM